MYRRINSASFIKAGS
uniref:Uncharacterized protein MANES_01G154200 n=1 Tax=Rhizophora mucronata TaxID=61149 RepID=A0A2P2LGD2_RHIMU